jgi:predicted SnoaL-like aldol condensation-catalyzing enzyme
VTAATAARRWATTWERAWADRDAEAILALYDESVAYRALAFRAPDLGLAGVGRYLEETFGVEDEIECRFGEPIVDGDRAAVEWWASWVEEGRARTLAGATFLRFDADGRVVDHRDYWNEADGREPAYPDW